MCQAVGFNTIPAWLRPFGVLSNGEKFRVTMARTLLELPELAVVDEFTSMGDRQVAQIGSHAVQKYVRKKGSHFVAVTCHYDVVGWLQPDWVLEPATGRFEWRSVQPRPKFNVTLSPVHHSAWKLFAPFHYLSADLHRAARCFCLFVDEKPAAFAACLHRPHARVDDIMGLSRLVCLPDFQGLGLAPRLSDWVGSLYKARGKRLHTYPAHPSLVRVYDRSENYVMVKKPGTFSTVSTSLTEGRNVIGGRPCAVFRYVGPAAALDDAAKVFSFWK